jgi:hypothetical protein
MPLATHSIATIFTEDYDLMHRCLGHPSLEVLPHAKEGTTGFSSMIFLKDTPICPACAARKTYQSSFPTSGARASKPLIKIHSDIKTFPIESYHCYKYFMSFVDDNSSFAWITCLRAKLSAIIALRHFLAMVKTQYGISIKEWMSDAGGEYKSTEFLKVLKDKGIKVLQSAPYTL